MRLTLRTMLAYLDDILEPSDAEQLGRKIEESKFASDLVHRVRSSITRLRLAAPKLQGRGMGLDPNTVAEYLDNTLPADRVPDFEKVCLESDVHLAEVASCHQILTLVLGEPAGVPPHARERVYKLATLDVPGAKDAAAMAAGAGAAAAAETARVNGNGKGEAQAEAAPAREAEEDVEAPPVQDADRLVEPPVEEEEPAEKVTRAKPEVPDYLRATRRPRMWPAVLALLLSFGLVVSFLWVTGPLSKEHPLAQAILGTSDTADAGASAQTTDGGQPNNADEESDGDTPAPDDASPAGKTPGGEPRADETPAKATDGPSRRRPVAPEDSVSLPGDDVIRPVTPGAATTPSEPPAEPPVPAGGETPGDGGKASPVSPPATTTVEPAEPRPSDTIPEEPPLTTPPTEPRPEVKPAGIDVGRFISDDQVMALEHVDEATWTRLPTGATLSSGNRLLALPTYRPQMALAPGIQVTLSGPALVQLAAPLGKGTPKMEMQYGRAVIATTGRADERIALQLGEREGVATFSSADTTLAVEVSNYLPPGSDPQAAAGGAGPSITVTRMYVVAGRVEWEEAGKLVAINAGQVRLLAEGSSGRTVTTRTLPDWVAPPGHGDPDRLASRTMEEFLKPEAPIRLTLNELLEDRRVEVRSLAVRCLSYLGQYEPFINELNDAFQKSYWDDSFDALRDAIARSPDSAAEVRAAFERQRGADGEKLYRMLWGYSPDQLAAGAAEELVNNLGHERMDFRVLAFENLRRITGMTLLYRPEYTERKNQANVQRWRERLKDMAIAYETPPTPLPEVEGSAVAAPGAKTGAAASPAKPAAPASPLEEEPKSPASGTPF